MRHFPLLVLLLTAAIARGQIIVDLTIKNRFYLLYEPVVATVNVTNQTGRDITLSDTPEFQWFAFRITGENDRMVAPRELHYKVPPIEVKAGERVKRSVNLTELYELDQVGKYRIQANIYFSGLDKFFASRPTFIDVNEGRVIWRQTAGVPEGLPNAGQTHSFTLMTHERGEKNTLYVRVQDENDGTIYGTYPIGRYVDETPPEAAFDAGNNLYILHLEGSRAYILTRISPNGEFAGQTNYTSGANRPKLRKTPAGGLQIVGGHREEPIAANATPAPIPKVSDRPPGFPKN